MVGRARRGKAGQDPDRVQREPSGSTSPSAGTAAATTVAARSKEAAEARGGAQKKKIKRTDTTKDTAVTGTKRSSFLQSWRARSTPA
jgi:hypothetical protein